MVSRIRDAAAPAYLLLCLTLGGSAQGIWANMTLQLLGLALIAWAALVPRTDPPPREERQLFLIILIGLLVVALQLVPLPPSIWEQLGGRTAITHGFGVLGLAPPPLPISTTPYDSAATLLTLIPPLALLAALARVGCRPLWLVLALVAGAFAGILLGALQVGGADPAASPWYLYEETNFGLATGFFANANHMATLLVITLPFLAALLATARSRGRNVQRYSAAVILIAAAALVVAVGLALNGSLAGYGLAVPVLVASALIVVPRRSAARRWLAPAAAVLLIVVVAGLAMSPIGGSGIKSNAAASVQSRHEIVATSAKATVDFMPLGSGLGSFPSIYALYEDHDRLDPTTYVPHAHNDYLELALETGIPGLVVLVLFLLWWGRAAWRAWTRPDATDYARAAAIASAAILVHSLVDFPLRTAAISACFAVSLALLIQRRAQPAAEATGLWPTRHVVLG
jgi:O-antigen ligase